MEEEQELRPTVTFTFGFHEDAEDILLVLDAHRFPIVINEFLNDIRASLKYNRPMGDKNNPDYETLEAVREVLLNHIDSYALKRYLL